MAQTHALPEPAASQPSTRLLPLAALMLAGALGTPGPAQAQNQVQASAQPEAEKTLKTVTVTAAPEGTEAKDSVRVTRTRIGKTEQELRDIPQTVTVMTERLIADRNFDDLKEVLKATAGVTFLAGETGEEDVRLRGFSLGQAGDIYVDGMRDAPIMERDTFNNDRIEVLKGSASMLFGKGSTGGVVNQVNKQAFLMDQNEVNLTAGTGNERRVTADLNKVTGENAALRVNLMRHLADNYGAKVDKAGLALDYRWGIGTRDEYEVAVYHLETRGRPQYMQRWLLNGSTITPMLPAKNFYGLSTDKLHTDSDYLTLGHTRRFDDGGELKTRLRVGHYERDLWGSVIGFASGTTLANFSGSTGITRQAKGRVAESDIGQLQTDYTRSFSALGYKHQLLSGADLYEERAKRANSHAGSNGANSASCVTDVNHPNVDSLTLANPVCRTRGAPTFTTFTARSLGLYAQDVVSLSDTVKLVGGLRFDRFIASYQNTSNLLLAQNLWSPRLGALYQPDATSSYYASAGSSYNLSGDAYQFTPSAPNAAEARTPAEKSRNFEVGGKWELFNKSTSLGVAWFRTEKYNERNKDPDSAASQYLLSGKRHATGLEFNLAGRISPRWEVFYNHTWIPEARIDNMNGATGTGNRPREGDRPGLTPRHSGSLWSTYQVLPKLRLGGGVNFRSDQTPELDKRYVAKGFATFDAMAEYTLTANTLVKLNVTNIADRLYADALYNSAFLPGAPRSVQLGVKTLF